MHKIEVSTDDLKAIRHGRIMLCNAGNVQYDHITGEYAATIDHDEDPAIADRVNSINLLEEILDMFDMGTASQISTAA